MQAIIGLLLKHQNGMILLTFRNTKEKHSHGKRGGFFRRIKTEGKRLRTRQNAAFKA